MKKTPNNMDLHQAGFNGASPNPNNPFNNDSSKPFDPNNPESYPYGARSGDDSFNPHIRSLFDKV